MIKGENICLRALEPEDIDLLYLWENDPSLWELSNTYLPFSRFILKQYIESSHLDIFSTKQMRFIIEDVNFSPIGAIDLFDFDPMHQRVGVGLLIYAEQNRKKNYASEAVELVCHYAKKHLNLHQIYANVGANNIASIGLFEKCGFLKVGIKKDWLRVNNCWQDELLYQRILS